MGDERIVQGPEVVFATTTPKPDVLQTGGGASVGDLVTTPISTPTIQEIMRQYACQVIRVIKKENKKIPKASQAQYESWEYNPIEFEYLIPHLCFNSDFVPRINPAISDHDLLAILNEGYPKLAAFVEKLGIYDEVKKDLSQAPAENGSWKHAAIYLNPLGFSAIKLSSELDNFQWGHNTSLTIPNEYFLSLFIEEGETYRQFLRFHTVPEDQEDPFFHASFNPWYNFLLIAHFGDSERARGRKAVRVMEVRQKSLEQFITSENGKRVRTFLTDLNNFREELTLGYGEDFHRRWSSWSNIKDEESADTTGERKACNLELRSLLYNRLKKYHPELTI